MFTGAGVVWFCLCKTPGLRISCLRSNVSYWRMRIMRTSMWKTKEGMVRYLYTCSTGTSKLNLLLFTCSGHPCPIPCHAPSACPSTDTEPCPVVVTVSCSCGRIMQPAPCGASRVLKCQDACSVAKRNARLADALGISESARAGGINSVTWSSDLIAFCRITANQAFVKNVEKALAE
jgi:transcriptional repressor NF-X1